MRTLFLAFLVMFFSPAARAAGFTVSVDEAKALLGKPNVVFWYTGTAASFEKAHIPGSVVAYTHDMAWLDDVQKCGGLPMCQETAEKFLGALGIGNDTTVIAYEDGKGANESGAWFFLNLYGDHDVRILEGGIVDWQAKGLPVEAGKQKPVAAKTFKATVDRSMIATAADVEAAEGKPGFLILDARHNLEEFTGQDLKDGMKNAHDHVTVAHGGHIPGAVFSPWTKYAGNPNGEAGKPVFRDAAAIQSTLGRLASRGYTEQTQVITYCHVGLGRGSFQYMGLKAAGHQNVKLYVGSWNEWGNSDRPVENQ